VILTPLKTSHRIAQKGTEKATAEPVLMKIRTETQMAAEMLC